MTFAEAVQVVVDGGHRPQTQAIALELEDSKIRDLFQGALIDLKKQDNLGNALADMLYIAAVAVRAKSLETPPS